MPTRCRDIDNTGCKKLIVCCDGTWMDSDNGHQATPSNVTRLARAILPADDHRIPQIVYYQAGIGTGLGLFSQILGGGTGLGFSENVREAYAFLASNYHHDALDPDQIFLIGFSRGAYTARSLGGLIGQLGLLKKEHMSWFYNIFEDWQNAGNKSYEPKFWKNWSKWNIEVNGREGASLKNTSKSSDPAKIHAYLEEYRERLINLNLTRDANIAAMGMFDTVGALGVPVNPWIKNVFGLPAFLHRYMWVDTSLDNRIKNAYQALALDEHRAPFYPSVWERPEGCQTNLKQTWFAGAHSSIGGAYIDIGQANITLAWMMDQLSGDELKGGQVWKPKEWLQFDKDFLGDQKLLNDWFQKKYYKTKEPRPWGLGAIYNSLIFPQVLAGSRTRRPGRTHRMRNDDFEHADELMRNTNEFIHASVRLRTKLGGKGFEKDPRDTFTRKVTSSIIRYGLKLFHLMTGRVGRPYYYPQTYGPLSDWELKDGQVYHHDYSFNTSETLDGKVPYWRYIGDDPLMTDPRRRLNEDKLGSHEKDLIGCYDRQMADYIIASNGGKKSVEDHPKARKDSVFVKAHTR